MRLLLVNTCKGNVVECMPSFCLGTGSRQPLRFSLYVYPVHAAGDVFQKANYLLTTLLAKLVQLLVLRCAGDMFLAKFVLRSEPEQSEPSEA